MAVGIAGTGKSLTAKSTLLPSILGNTTSSLLPLITAKRDLSWSHGASSQTVDQITSIPVGVFAIPSQHVDRIGAVLDEDLDNCSDLLYR